MKRIVGAFKSEPKVNLEDYEELTREQARKRRRDIEDLTEEIRKLYTRYQQATNPYQQQQLLRQLQPLYQRKKQYEQQMNHFRNEEMQITQMQAARDNIKLMQMKSQVMKQNVKNLKKLMKTVNVSKMEKYQDNYMDMMDQMDEINDISNQSYQVEGDMSNEAMLAELEGMNGMEGMEEFSSGGMSESWNNFEEPTTTTSNNNTIERDMNSLDHLLQ